MTITGTEWPLLLRYQQAWEALGYGRTRFMRELKRGRIPVLRTPAGPRIKTADLLAYIERLEREQEQKQAS